MLEGVNYCLLVAASLCSVLLCAEPLRYECRRAATPIRIDGRLDDSAWNAAPWSSEFVDIEGSKKPLPRFRTRMKMLWDDQYLYVAAELEEPDLSASLTAHDSVIFKDNDFEVFLKPSASGSAYFEFEMNALNTTWDLFLNKPYREDGKADNSWEMPGLKSAVHLNGTLNDPSDRDQGWTIEIAFPWADFASRASAVKRPEPGEEWRVNFSRVEWKYDVVDAKYVKVPKLPENNWVWTPQGVVNMHIPEEWGFVSFRMR
jgi:hypothetical protein